MGFHMEITATSKGQIVIPSKVRKRFKIKEGKQFQIEIDEKEFRIILRPITREYIHSLRGKFKGKGLMKTLMDEKKRVRELQ